MGFGATGGATVVLDLMCGSGLLDDDDDDEDGMDTDPGMLGPPGRCACGCECECECECGCGCECA